MDKILTWLKGAGLRSVGYLIGAIILKLLFGSQLLLGVGIGIFLADNWITIRQLIKDNVKGISS